MSEIAELFYPAIRWDATHGFEAQRAAIDEALKLGVGGFILFGGPSEHVASLTEDLHSKSRIPLLIGADLERGAGQQFAGQTALPPLAAIASLEDLQAIRRAAAVSAIEARSLGINWIYAPDCDIDVEPNNPIIGTRSFGSDPERVAEYAAAWIDACQAEGVLACAKHFPGHGRTTVDSHKETPRVDESAETLRQTDLVPFRRAIERGVASVMSAHVAFPALDPTGAPATLSRAILDRSAPRRDGVHRSRRHRCAHNGGRPGRRRSRGSRARVVRRMRLPSLSHEPRRIRASRAKGDR